MRPNTLLSVMVLAGAAATASLAAIPASAQSYQVAFGTTHSNGSLERAEGAFSWRQSEGRFDYLFSEFTNPAAVIFATHDKNHAVRFGFYGESTNRNLYARSDLYDLRDHEGDRPKLANGKVSFVALSRSDITPVQATGANDIKTPPKDAKAPALVGADKVQIALGRIKDDTFKGKGISGTPGQATSTGVYAFTFSPAFKHAPAVLVTYNDRDKNQKNEDVRSVYVKSVSSSTVEIGITDESGKPVNADFTFIAFGDMGEDAKSTDTLSNTTIAYGRYKLHGDRSFGDGAGDAKKRSPAEYEVTFSPTFAAEPYVVVTTEHTEDRHLRQAQVEASPSKAIIQVVGRTKCCGKGSGNDARFDYIAILPK